MKAASLGNLWGGSFTACCGVIYFNRSKYIPEEAGIYKLRKLSLCGVFIVKGRGNAHGGLQNV
jgi:hypothetical protein